MLAFLISALSLTAACSPTAVETPAEELKGEARAALSRGAVQHIIRDARMIRTPHGVDELKEVEIGGIGQWISVRGRDRRNPVLLFIHGGPGTTEMPVSWFYQAPLEDYFVVVQWDQRGSGKTAVSNDQATVVPTITVARMIEDAEEMVAHLRTEYGKDKIFVLGHSWGSLLGLELALRRPEWMHAYIGMGQFIYTHDNETVGYRFALDEARRRNDAAALEELEAIAPYPKADGGLRVQDVIIQRKWVSAYGGMTRGRSNLDWENNLRGLSPDYSDADLAADSEIGSIVAQLLPQLANIDYRDATRLETPAFLFSGRHDFATPSEVSAAWFENLQAPAKRIFWFEHAAHMMHFEQPGKFALHLIQDIRPIAVRAGDAAPEDAAGAGR